MKSNRVSELVEVFYWTCTVNEHRHKTKAIADACIAKKSAARKEVRRWTRRMIADAIESILNGASWREVARSFNVSPSRITQIIHHAMRIMDPLSSSTIPYDARRNIGEIREYADFWREKLKEYCRDEA